MFRHLWCQCCDEGWENVKNTGMTLGGVVGIHAAQSGCWWQGPLVGTLEAGPGTFGKLWHQKDMAGCDRCLPGSWGIHILCCGGTQGHRSAQSNMQLRGAGTGQADYAQPSAPHWMALGQNNRSLWRALAPGDDGSSRR